METRKPVRRPTQCELDRLQIEEYIATNHKGPRDHSFTILSSKAVPISDKPKD